MKPHSSISLVASMPRGAAHRPRTRGPSAKSAAKAKAAPKPKASASKKLVDKTEAEDAVARSSSSKELNDPTPFIKKIIYDNFAGYSHFELYVKEVGGLCLWDTLVRDRKLRDQGKIVMGSITTRRSVRSSWTPVHPWRFYNPLMTLKRWMKL